MSIGIVGGSGVYQLEEAEMVEEWEVETPFGRPSHPLFEMKLGSSSFFFIARHGKGHAVLPHEVNYRANIFALKKMGVEYVISISAVGSLKEDIVPGSVVLPDQFIDWTRGQRKRTFFGDGLVGHVSTAYPVQSQLREMMASACKKTGVDYCNGGTYICIEGPQFSSLAESNLYRSFGASVIGMTGVPESYLAKEAGMAYATMAMVTDFDCWKEEPCSVEAIMKVMQENGTNVLQILSHLIPALGAQPFDFLKENRLGLMTSKEDMTAEQLEIVEMLLR